MHTRRIIFCLVATLAFLLPALAQQPKKQGEKGKPVTRKVVDLPPIKKEVPKPKAADKTKRTVSYRMSVPGEWRIRGAQDVVRAQAIKQRVSGAGWVIRQPSKPAAATQDEYN